MKKKNLLKGIIISAVTLIFGYMAIAIPFNLFSTFSDTGLKVFFWVELSIYIIATLAYLSYKDIKAQNAKKQRELHIKRQAKIEDVKENWYNIAA